MPHPRGGSEQQAAFEPASLKKVQPEWGSGESAPPPSDVRENTIVLVVYFTKLKGSIWNRLTLHGSVTEFSALVEVPSKTPGQG